MSIVPRQSNLELYRIISMLMIVAHHYVANSGIFSAGGGVLANPISANSVYLALFGAWGKIGINCFLMITGYFMCTAQITFRKFLKFLLQIYLYKLLVFVVLLFAGYESVSLSRIVKLILPLRGFSSNDFISCYLAFWVTIPFYNILVHHLTKRQHVLLIMLSLCFFTVLASLPHFDVPLNYITWFGIIFFIASFFRLYPNPIFDNLSLWGWLTVFAFFLVIASVTIGQFLYGEKGMEYSYFLVRDSNKILAVFFAVCSFLWFKNMNIKYSKVINAFGAGTFGVLLIHANSDAMRTWLWKDTVDCVGHFSLPLGSLVLYSVSVVLTVFVVCNLIDQLRIATIEKWFFRWYDHRFASKAEFFVDGLINGKHSS